MPSSNASLSFSPEAYGRLTPQQRAEVLFLAEQRAKLLAARPEATQADQATAATRSFRAFAASPAFCALDLSPLVAAIMDASEGRRPETIDDATAERHFGCGLDGLPTVAPRTVVARAGGRGGKTSRLLAPKALHAAWTVPVPLLGKGEEAYAVFGAPSLRLARQTLSFCRGYVEASPVLARAVIGGSTDHIALRRPDGIPVRIEAFAASRGGTQFRAKTLVFAGFDEAAFFRDEATGVVNDAELYRAVLQRLVPGAQAWLASTPWLAGVGLIEEFIGREFGTHEHALCAVAPTRALNPNWDPTGEIEADLRAQDPDAAEREIDAIPLAAGSQMFFSPEAITAAVNEARPLRLTRDPLAVYGAGGDAGLRRNSSALAVVAHRDGRFRLAALEELKPTPGLPLKPSGVVDHFAPVLADYRATVVTADAHERAELGLEFARHGVSVAHDPGKVESYIFARKVLHEGRLELPDHPRLRRQLRDVVSKPQPGGGLTITSPRKADGSHGDLVSALVLALWAAAHAQPLRDDEPDDGAIPVPPRFAY